LSERRALAAAAAVLVAGAAAAAHATAPAARHVLATPGPASLARAAPAPIRDRVVLAATRRPSIVGPPPGYWGGPTASTSGETTISVYVSDRYPQDPAAARKWVDLLEWFDHGPELERVTLLLAPPEDIAALCGSGDVVACYEPLGELIVAPGDGQDDLSQVLAHEYGHHIAFHRANPPWLAETWGPKYWATAADVCHRQSDGDAYPGDEGLHYGRNPGEAWAETYRLLEVQRAQQTTPAPDWAAAARHLVVDESFRPGQAELAAALRDVSAPWSTPTRTTWTARLTRADGFTAQETVRTPADGTLTVRAASGVTDVSAAPVGAAGRATSSRTTLVAKVCGARVFRLRVRGARAAVVRVAVSVP
jgi:hypothetical protein